MEFELKAVKLSRALAVANEADALTEAVSEADAGTDALPLKLERTEDEGEDDAEAHKDG